MNFRYISILFTGILYTLQVSGQGNRLAVYHENTEINSTISSKRMYEDNPRESYTNRTYLRKNSKDTLIGYDIVLYPALVDHYYYYYQNGVLYRINPSTKEYNANAVTEWDLSLQGMYYLYLSVPSHWLDDFEGFSNKFTSQDVTGNRDTVQLHLQYQEKDFQRDCYYTFTKDSLLLRRKIMVYVGHDSEVLTVNYDYRRSELRVFDSAQDQVDQFRYVELEKNPVKLDSIHVHQSKTLDSALRAYFNANPEHPYVLVDFWYYECKYCHLTNKIIRELVEEEGLNVISAYYRRKPLSELIKARLSTDFNHFRSIVFLSASDMKSLGIYGYPRIIIVDTELNVVFDHVGYSEHFKEEVLKVMGEFKE